MTSMIRAVGGNAAPPSLPTFSEADSLVGKLEHARDAYAIAREPSHELLALLDVAIADAAAGAVHLARLAKPGKKLNIGSYLGLLLDAYPSSGSQNAESFGGLLLDDVMELAPPTAAVEIACRRWRQKSKFPPAISELLAEVTRLKDRIDTVIEFVPRLPAIRARMARDLGLS